MRTWAGNRARACRWAWAPLLGALVAATAGAGEPDVRRDAAVEAVAGVMPCVVNVATETIVAVRDPFEGLLRDFWDPYYQQQRPRTQYSLGSGVIIDEAGYVLTCEHVVRRASGIWVRLADEGGGKEYEAKRVAGSSRSDIAILRILAPSGTRFKAVRFAQEDDLLLGETVLALGNPFGLGGSVSRGILSSKSRRPPIQNQPLDLADWLQTDAAINPGSSGGPLVDLRGQLIGLNVAVYREGQGIGFAIPIKRVAEALSEVFSPELRQLWFGARVRPEGSGLRVAAVEADSPAQRAGLRPGDVVLGLDGKRPRGFIEFNQMLFAAGDKQPVNLLVDRNGARETVTLHLVPEASVFNAKLIRDKLGLSVQMLTPDLADQLNLPSTEGLLIAGVDRDSPASAVGLRRGHVILAVDGQAPDNLIAAARILYGKKKGEKVPLDILVQRQEGVFLIHQRVSVELATR